MKLCPSSTACQSPNNAPRHLVIAVVYVPSHVTCCGPLAFVHPDPHPHASECLNDCPASCLLLAVELLEDKLGDAGQPRANRAATVEKPEGNPNRCKGGRSCKDRLSLSSLSRDYHHAQLTAPSADCCRLIATCTDHVAHIRSPDNRTVLQQHVDFFDRNNDGIIYPSDTYVGDFLLHILNMCTSTTRLQPTSWRFHDVEHETRAKPSCKSIYLANSGS